MNSSANVAVIVGCLTILSAFQGCRNEKAAVPTPEKGEGLTVVQRLMSKDGKEMVAARDELIAARKELLRQLIGIIEEQKNRINRQSSVRVAMYVLGEMRAVEAVDVLVKYIGFPRIYEGEAGIVSLDGGTMLYRDLNKIRSVYPPADALIKIGEPCIDAVISKVGSAETNYEREACLGVLVGLRGRDWTVETLTTAMEKETDAEKKRWLKRSLDALAEVPD